MSIKDKTIQEMMPSDEGRDRFKIVIAIKQNCQSYKIEAEENEKFTIQEVIGALEYCKLSFMMQQSISNLETWAKLKKDQQ